MGTHAARLKRTIVLLAILPLGGCTPWLRLYDLGSSGSVVAGAGDVDGDQIPDLVFGYPCCNTMRIVSGALEWTSWGGFNDGRRSVDGGQDVDGDAVPDIVGGSGSSITVYSSASEVVLHRILAEQSGDGFGAQVAFIDDLDGDDRPDVMASAPEFDAFAGSDAGKVYVFSGSTGAAILTLEGEAEGDSFGRSLLPLDDVDGDQFPDVVVGAPRYDGPGGTDAGRIYVISGASGGLIYTVDGAGARAELGRFIDGLGDVTGDGRGDFIESSLGPLAAVGTVSIRNGADGTTIRQHFGSLDFGRSLAGPGDMDGDAIPDYVIGAVNEAVAYSGESGGFLERYSLVDRFLTGGDLGASMARVGDLDGDGRADVAVGAPGFSDLPGIRGAVLVYSAPAHVQVLP